MFWRPNLGLKDGAGPVDNSRNVVTTLKWLAGHGLEAH
jgi:hypothetical protein